MIIIIITNYRNNIIQRGFIVTSLLPWGSDRVLWANSWRLRPQSDPQAIMCQAMQKGKLVGTGQRKQS